MILRLLYSSITTLLLIATHGQSYSMETTSVYDAPKYSGQMEGFRRHSPIDRDSNIWMPECPRPYSKIDFVDSLVEHKRDSYEIKVKTLFDSLSFDNIAPVEKLNLAPLSIRVNLSTVDELFGESKRFDPVLKVNLSSLELDRLDLYESKIKISSDYKLFDDIDLVIKTNLEPLSIDNLYSKDKIFSECKWFDPGPGLDLSTLVLSAHEGGNQQTGVGRAVTSTGSFYIPILFSCLVCVLNTYSSYS